MAKPKMEEYTVVLIRPDYIADPYGQDCYVALGVHALNPASAIRQAQLEASEVDAQDNAAAEPEDYHPLVTFKGRCKIARFGWMS